MELRLQQTSARLQNWLHLNNAGIVGSYLDQMVRMHHKLFMAISAYPELCDHDVLSSIESHCNQVDDYVHALSTGSKHAISESETRELFESYRTALLHLVSIFHIGIVELSHQDCAGCPIQVSGPRSGLEAKPPDLAGEG